MNMIIILALIVIIWIFGGVVHYVLFKVNHMNRNESWTRADRSEALLFSILSWIGVCIELIYWGDPDKKVKW